MARCDAPQRRYFTVVDEAGRALPAVEYWAGALEAEAAGRGCIALRRFIRLIGSEPMREVEPGTFRGVDSGAHYFPAG